MRIKQMTKIFEEMTDVEKFDYLWSLGQRQFPMRGGGVSPLIKRLKEVKGSLDCHKYTTEHGFGNNNHYWREDGKMQVELWGSFDLLPITISDYQSKYEALVKACDPLINSLTKNRTVEFDYSDECSLTRFPKEFENVTLGDLRAIAKRGKNESY